MVSRTWSTVHGRQYMVDRTSTRGQQYMEISRAAEAQSSRLAAEMSFELKALSVLSVNSGKRKPAALVYLS